MPFEQLISRANCKEKIVSYVLWDVFCTSVLSAWMCARPSAVSRQKQSFSHLLATDQRGHKIKVFVTKLQFPIEKKKKKEIRDVNSKLNRGENFPETSEAKILKN